MHKRWQDIPLVHSDNCSDSDVFNFRWSRTGKPCPAPCAGWEGHAIHHARVTPNPTSSPAALHQRDIWETHSLLLPAISSAKNQPTASEEKGSKEEKVPGNRSNLFQEADQDCDKHSFGHALGSNNRHILQLKLVKIHAPLPCRRDYRWSVG